MVRIRLWLFGIISAMLGLRMLQMLCRLPIKLHSYYMRINVRFKLLAIAFEHILIRHIIYNNGDEINSEFGQDYTVQGIDMKCFLTGSSVMCFCHFTF